MVRCHIVGEFVEEALVSNFVRYAFWKNRRMGSVCILLSMLCPRLSTSWISCVSVDQCFLNPCYASWRM